MDVVHVFQIQYNEATTMLNVFILFHLRDAVTLLREVELLSGECRESFWSWTPGSVLKEE